MECYQHRVKGEDKLTIVFCRTACIIGIIIGGFIGFWIGRAWQDSVYKDIAPNWHREHIQK